MAASDDEQLPTGEPAPDAAKPKRKAGKPPLQLADTFDEQMALLDEPEQQFVRHVLAGRNQSEAFALMRPTVQGRQAKANGGKTLAHRADVKRALALGRKAGALAAITGLKYDLTAADEQLVSLIDEARHAGQYSAVASIVRERLRLHKLTDAGPQAQAGAQFTLVIQGTDGASRTVEPQKDGHVIDVQPIQPEDGK